MRDSTDISMRSDTRRYFESNLIQQNLAWLHVAMMTEMFLFEKQVRSRSFRILSLAACGSGSGSDLEPLSRPYYRMKGAMISLLLPRGGSGGFARPRVSQLSKVFRNRRSRQPR
jgi:hypothetical protein